MTDAGMLSIVKRGEMYEVRYASSNPYDMERPPYTCPDAGVLGTWLCHWGVDAWSLQQTVATLQKGGVAVLPVILSDGQLQASFAHRATPAPA